MTEKYTNDQINEANFLGTQAEYYEKRFKEHIQNRNPLFIFDALRIIWISLLFRIKFKDEYLKAKYKTYRS